MLYGNCSKCGTQGFLNKDNLCGQCQIKKIKNVTNNIIHERDCYKKIIDDMQKQAIENGYGTYIDDKFEWIKKDNKQ